MARFVTVEGVPAPRGARKKPVRLVRGRRLKALVGAITHLNTLFNQDEAENTRSAIRGYTPYLILSTPGSRINNAFNNLLKALEDAKKATA